MVDEVALAEVELGMEAEQFLNSTIGQYVVGCAEKEREIVSELLLQANPDDAMEIRGLQFRAAVALKAVGWLTSVMQDGLIAAKMIENEDTPE